VKIITKSIIKLKNYIQCLSNKIYESHHPSGLTELREITRPLYPKTEGNLAMEPDILLSGTSLMELQRRKI